MPPAAGAKTEAEESEPGDDEKPVPADGPPGSRIKKVKAVDGNAPIEFVPPVMDLGLLEPYEERQVEFQVFNRSPKPLLITSINAGCPCVTDVHEKGMIQPGASGKVSLKVKGVTSGHRRLTLVVNTTDRQHPDKEYRISYACVPELILFPKRIDFGSPGVGDPGEQLVNVTLHLPDEIKEDPPLEPFLAHPDLPIKLTFDPPTITRVTEGFRDLVTTLHATIDTSRAVPEFETQLVFQPKQPKTFRQTVIPVKGKVRATWFFDHETISLGVIGVGETATKSARFFYPGDKAPEVVELVAEPADLFTVTQEVVAEKRCIQINVACTPKASGALEGTVRLKTSLSSEPVHLKITGRVR